MLWFTVVVKDDEDEPSESPGVIVPTGESLEGVVVVSGDAVDRGFWGFAEEQSSPPSFGFAFSQHDLDFGGLSGRGRFRLHFVDEESPPELFGLMVALGMDTVATVTTPLFSTPMIQADRGSNGPEGPGKRWT